MAQASFRFYGPLNDFLEAERRGRSFPLAFNPGQTVKHLLEALGVPHTEVDLLLVNGEPVDFAYQVVGGDRVSIYPWFENLDISQISLVQPEPLDELRFVLDNHLGRLAAYLRMLGFDTLYRNDFHDPTLAGLSAKEKRVLLTRDQDLLKRREITHGYWVREKNPARQLAEVVRRFKLETSLKPFQRCLRCNGLLHAVPKERILHRLEPKTRQYYHEFALCPDCDRVYWKGSHWERMQRLIDSIVGGEAPGSRRSF